MNARATIGEVAMAVVFFLVVFYATYGLFSFASKVVELHSRAGVAEVQNP